MEDCEVGKESDSQNEVKEVTHSQSLQLLVLPRQNPRKPRSRPSHDAQEFLVA